MEEKVVPKVIWRFHSMYWICLSNSSVHGACRWSAYIKTCCTNYNHWGQKLVCSILAIPPVDHIFLLAIAVITPPLLIASNPNQVNYCGLKNPSISCSLWTLRLLKLFKIWLLEKQSCVYIFVSGQIYINRYTQWKC